MTCVKSGLPKFSKNFLTRQFSSTTGEVGLVWQSDKIQIVFPVALADDHQSLAVGMPFGIVIAFFGRRHMLLIRNHLRP